jgi:hypothetical protein
VVTEDLQAPEPFGRWLSRSEPCGTSYAYPYPRNNGKVTVSAIARQELNVFHNRDGTAFAMLAAQGSGTSTTVYPESGLNGPCTVTIDAHTKWSLKEQRRVDKVPLEIARRGERDLHNHRERPTNDDHDRLVQRSTDNCGIRLPPPDAPEPPIETTWEPVKFVISCPANFTTAANNTIDCSSPWPGRPSTLNGTLKRTVIGQGDPISQESWLSVSPAGTSRADDGTPIPITVSVIWNLPAGP